MKLKIFDLRISNGTGSLDCDAMETFLADKQIISVSDHLADDRGNTHLFVVVTYRDPNDQRGKRQPAEQRPEQNLSDNDRLCFDSLRAWRKDRAVREGIPVYQILNNRQLARIAQDRPDSISALRRIDGVGQGTTNRFGKEILSALRQFAQDDHTQPNQPQHTTTSQTSAESNTDTPPPKSSSEQHQ